MGVVLVGYRGSGKSTVGRILAHKLAWELLDTDAMIVQAVGKTIKEIFEQDGEVRFRELESQSLEQALKGTNRVIATGGGIVMREANRAAIGASGHLPVYLCGSPAKLLERIRGDVATAANRPNLTGLGGGVEEIEHLLQIRDPLYREVAKLVLSTDDLSPAKLAERIARHLGVQV